MKSNLKKYEKYLGKINEFKEIGWVRNYIDLKKRPNFWTILEYGKIQDSRQRSSHEIRYSKMLRWLLDANENHNLGNTFAYELLKKIDRDINYKHSLSKNRLIHSKTEALDNIDVFYKDLNQRICIAVELKQYSSEHESTEYTSQLDKYEDSVNKFIEKNEQDIVPYYIYLTPTKENPSNKNWHPLGYGDLINIIEKVHEKYISTTNDIYKSDIEKIIQDFKDDLQRTVDIVEKDLSYIRDNFTKGDMEFTISLADEILHESDSKQLEKLIELDGENNPDLKEVILLIKEYYAIQDHTPNDGIRLLMRKIFNYISQGPDIDLDLKVNPTSQDRKKKIKEDLIKKYNLEFDQVRLTQGKGQGIYIYSDKREEFIYFSGDATGKFPNDYMSVHKNKKEKMIKSNTIINNMFQVDYDQIKENKITLNKKDGGSDQISFKDFMELYVIEGIKELSHRFIQGEE